jgi:glycosyltransferase involved in cell wall biosynthesis
MKLLLLSDSETPHTIKWTRYLSHHLDQIYLFSIFPPVSDQLSSLKNVTIVSSDIDRSVFLKKEGSIGKLHYLRTIPIIKKMIKKYKPDILHAHYLSSYGLLGALSGFHPFILSVWGSDIFNFPNISILHNKLSKYILSRTDRILSTSHIMASEISKYTRKPITVTPFGIDTDVFKPAIQQKEPGEIRIGIIKSLEEKYGIEYLLKAFKIVLSKTQTAKLSLTIVGGGLLKEKLISLAKELDIFEYTKFIGKIPSDEVIYYHNMLDIAVFPSIEDSESFGVAVIEASACEKPVIASRVGGFPEVIDHNVTGLLVPPKNEVALASAIESLLNDEQLRNQFGIAGRKMVKKKYNLKDNLEQMITIYDETLVNIT